jgi:hypothetical protein
VRRWDTVACEELPQPPALDHSQSSVQAAAGAALANAPGAGAQRVATGNDAETLSAMRQDPDGGWRRLCRLQIAWTPIVDLAFAPRGRSVATAGEDGPAVLVPVDDAGCGEPLVLDGQNTTLYSVAFAPDGAARVTAALDARAQVWSTQWEFSPDGNSIGAAC